MQDNDPVVVPTNQILIIPVANGVRIAINGVCYEKPMTRDMYLIAAARFLEAATHSED